LHKKREGLSAWQLTMLALGTVIGGSFFVGVSVAIQAAGAGVILAFMAGGALVYVILYALSEMTVDDPAPGSFRTFAEKAFGPAAGFIVGWIYWTGLTLAMSSEAVAVSGLLKNWFPEVSLPILGAGIILFVTVLNLVGANRLSKLESGLAAIKLIAIVGFVVVGVAILSGIMPGVWQSVEGLGAQPVFPHGLGGLAGSMLMVMFAYAGFEVIGLAASESDNPQRTIPRAITYTTFGLVALYVGSVACLLLLVPAADAVSTAQSPFVAALTQQNFSLAGSVMDVVLVTAILSTMLAAMFGLGRMVRSLAADGHAPSWLNDEADIPRRGIAFSGVAMLGGLGLSLFLPEEVYLFLVSAGGFALLFSYLVILLTHYKLRSKQGCSSQGKCQLPGFPYTSWLAIASTVLIIASMPLIPGQGLGLFAGLSFLTFFLVLYLAIRSRTKKLAKENAFWGKTASLEAQFEISQELTPEKASRRRKDK